MACSLIPRLRLAFPRLRLAVPSLRLPVTNYVNSTLIRPNLFRFCGWICPSPLPNCGVSIFELPNGPDLPNVPFQLLRRPSPSNLVRPKFDLFRVASAPFPPVIQGASPLLICSFPCQACPSLRSCPLPRQAGPSLRICPFLLRRTLECFSLFALPISLAYGA